MANLGVCIGIAVGVCGLIGASYWYRASRSSRWNRIAAVWTAVASVLAIFGSLVSWLAGPSLLPAGAVFNAGNTTIQGGAGINSGTINNYNAPAPLPLASGATPRTYEGGSGIPIDDIEVRGVLKPADAPTPSNGCGSTGGQDTVKVLIGDNAIEHTGLGLFTAIGIGKCEPLSIERREDGIFVNASLYDRDRGAVVLIKDNRITALNGEDYTARQSSDESRLIVENSRGTELFYIRFLNPTTIQFRGFLGCAGGPVVHIQEGQPVPGLLMSNSCFGNARRGIQIGKP